MPLIRFMLFASGFIVCGFIAANALLTSTATSRPDPQPSQSSLADWRNAEARKVGRAAEAAIVLPSIAQSTPTAERLAFERQLASNTVPAQVFAESEPPRMTDARAELTEAAPQRAASSKPKRKPAPRPEIATAERTAPREFGGFFGGIFSN